VASIGPCCFKECSSLSLVTILNPLTRIGKECFEGCPCKI
jgi:hypothetical protein